MSFLKCCVGADPRPPPEQIRPVGASSNPNRRPPTNRANNHLQPASSLRPDSLPGAKKLKLPTEVFFDPTKPDGQLSSVTDPPNSARDYSEAKKKKDAKDRSGRDHRDNRKDANVNEKPEMDFPDNNGLTRGQNFMKVEKWLRNASMYQQVDVTPGTITNIEDNPTNLPDNADPPSEKDRIPQAITSQHHQTTRAR